MDMSKALFITGTGTDIGKTYVTGLIVKKLAEEGKSAAYYKAAMSEMCIRDSSSSVRQHSGACNVRRYVTAYYRILRNTNLV